MMTFMAQDPMSPATTSHSSVANVVDAMGQERFGPTFAAFLYELCGAEHFAAFRFGQGELYGVAACCVEPARTAHDHVKNYLHLGLWKKDPAMAEARRCAQSALPTLIHVDLSERGYLDLRPRVYPHVRDRLLLCGRSASGAFCLSVLRSDPHAAFDDSSIRRLTESTDLLVAMLSKHTALLQRRPNAAQALSTLADIESCIVATCSLPRREAEVCARILYGLSSAGIALDLSVSEETVKTYRKRAYQRLNIGSERELLTRYLALWGPWSAQRDEMQVSASGLFALH